MATFSSTTGGWGGSGGPSVGGVSISGGKATKGGTTQGGKSLTEQISDILGGSWSVGGNRAYAYDPTSNNVVQIGAPSLAGGMLTTAAGGRLGRLAGGIGGLGPIDWGGASMSSKKSPFHQTYYSSLQNRISSEADARRGSELSMRSAIDKSNLGWADRVKAVEALSSGKLGALDSLGFDTSGMRETHHSGGLLGGIFGRKGDDVETMSEVESKLMGAGHLAVNPETGQLEKAGFGPMHPGFALSMAAPAIGQKVAEATYGYTQDPSTAIGAGRLAGGLASKAGTSMQPSAGGLLTGLAGFTGIPGATQLGQMAGSLGTAADLAYAGITASPQAVGETFSEGVYGQEQQPSYTPSLPQTQSLLGPEMAPYGRLYLNRGLPV